MKSYVVEQTHIVKNTVEVIVLAESEEEAIKKAQDGDIEEEEVVDEYGLETKDYRIMDYAETGE